MDISLQQQFALAGFPIPNPTTDDVRFYPSINSVFDCHSRQNGTSIVFDISGTQHTGANLDEALLALWKSINHLA